MINGNTPEGGWRQQVRLLDSLLMSASSYGPDATGFVAHTSPFNSPFNMRLMRDKQPLKA